MKLSNANAIRAKFISELIGLYEGEDVGMIASNSFNLPVVAEDGEEGWVEIVVKVTKDLGDDGYMKREQYSDKVALAEERAKAKVEKAKKEKGKEKKSG